MKKVFIIAEAGVNHNGSIRTAMRLVRAAKRAGADAVKFQIFKAEDFISRFAKKADYQKNKTVKYQNQLEMVRSLELNDSEHKKITFYCREKNIECISSPFDLNSVKLLKELNIRTIKIASGEITNLPLLEAIGALRKQIILSTGMSTISEISQALNILKKSGTLKSKMILLHCNTEYPTPSEDANIRAIVTLKRVFKMDTGYSDHTLGIEIATAAAALGASVIEKHITLDKKMQGPDHASSIEPSEFKDMVCAIRKIEEALGDGVKRPSRSEIKNVAITRKSIVAAKDIKKGDIFTENNIAVKRPGIGISPMKWHKMIGKKASYSYKKDECI